MSDDERQRARVIALMWNARLERGNFDPDSPEMEDLAMLISNAIRESKAELARLRAAVADVLALTDTGSAEFLRAFGPNLTWRALAEKIRERLLS